MQAQVKICGITTGQALETAIAGGADYIGLVMFPKSPRHLDLADANALASAARGRTRSVVLLVDPEDALFDQVCAEIAPDLIQLHGRETPERVRELRARGSIPVIKAVSVATAADIAKADAYRQAGGADVILFDAAPSLASGATLPGGNGLRFDWQILDGIARRFPFALAGGLDADNVAEAIRLTGAAIVDVSSGVESSPGVKDLQRIAAFLKAAKSPNLQAG